MPKDNGATSRNNKSWTFPDVSPMRMAAWITSHCPVWVDALVQFLATEKILQTLLDLWDSCWSSNQRNVTDMRLVHLGVSQGFFHRLKCSSEEVWAQLFKARSGDGRVEIDALVQRVDLNAGLRAGREGSLGSLTCCPQPPQLSKSSPPRWVSPAVAFTSKMPSSMVRMDTSKVPPPRSKIRTLRSEALTLSRQWAMAAAVGSLMILRTFSPAITPASLVACLWESLK